MAVPLILTARSDRAVRAARSEPRTPSFGVYLLNYNLRDLPGVTIRVTSGYGRKMTISDHTNL
eukprot:4123468-Pleurochrysis_carterae.AAC.1